MTKKNEKENLVRSRGYLLVSMTIFGTLAVFVKHIPLDSGELALYRAVLANLLIGGYLFLAKDWPVFSVVKKELPLLLFSGAAIGINWILLFQSYRYTSVSIATLSYYFAPIIVTILCPLLFRESLTRKQMICFAMSTLGVVLLIGLPGISPWQKGGKDLIGIGFGLSAACFYAAVILINKKIKTVTGIHRTFLQFCAAIAVLLPYVGFTSGFHLEDLQAKAWVNLLIVGLVHTGITYCLYFSSLKELPGQEAAILSYVDPLAAVVISVTILGEKISLFQLIGGVLILGFALWNEKGE